MIVAHNTGKSLWTPQTPDGAQEGLVLKPSGADCRCFVIVAIIGDSVYSELSIRPINFPFPEFQAARRVKHLTLAVAGYPLVTLTGMSADAGFPRQQHS